MAGNRAFHVTSIAIDRRREKTDILYVADSGNNRILGFKSLGVCSNNKAQACTNSKDCVDSKRCIINRNKKADKVFGQADFSSAACNHDNMKGRDKEAGNNSLCLLNLPHRTNLAEY
ncbi:MAG: hypothetical protein IT292_05800 [Deltaproteobacteria bacterium]|nr:hypothetical protein [Deltaproteobacteria bacterium]